MSKPFNSVPMAELIQAVRQATGHEAKKPKQTPASQAIDAAMKRAGVRDAKATVTKTMLVLRVPLTGVVAIGRELAEVVFTKGGT